MNECYFMGHIVANPESFSLAGGKTVTKFVLAVNSQRKNKEQVAVSNEVAFIDCEVWDKAAEVVSSNCIKGTKLMVQARARTDSWVDKNTGAKRSSLRFRVNKFWFMGDRPEMQVSGETESVPYSEKIPY